MKLIPYPQKSALLILAIVAAVLITPISIGFRHSTTSAAASPLNQSAPHLLHTSWQQGNTSTVSPAKAAELYQDKCAMCHQADRAGVPPAFPSLIGVGDRYSDAQIASQIRQGKGRMPAFPKLSDEEVIALVAYIKTPATPAAAPANSFTSSPRALLANSAAMFLVIH